MNYVKFPANQCSEYYTGETAQRLPESVLGHNGRDAKSQLIAYHQKKSQIHWNREVWYIL